MTTAASPRSLPALVLFDGAAFDGPPDALDTLVEARVVTAALERLGYLVELVPVGLDLGALERRLARSAPAVAFNLVESIGGHGSLIGVVPALLASLGIPFTGCGATALALGADKPAAKRCFAAAGIPVPESFVPGTPLIGPWIVKSVVEHASFGLDDGAVVAATADVPRRLAECARLGRGAFFAERFIDGRELNVALLETADGVRVLPVAELVFDYPPGKPRIVGYAAKWDTASAEYHGSRRQFVADEALAARAGELALACWRIAGAGGCARVDLRVDVGGRCHVLELNGNPCLSPEAGFAAALERAGLTFDAAVECLLDAAFRRAGLARPGAAAAAGPRLHVQHS